MPNHIFSLGDKNFEYYNGMYYFQVSELPAGKTFGELALLNSDNKRNATVKCVTTVTYAVLDRRNFDRSLKKIEARLTSKRIEFLAGIPCFLGMKKAVVQKFI